MHCRSGIDQFVLASRRLERSAIPIEVTQPQVAPTVGPFKSRVAVAEVAARTIDALACRVELDVPEAGGGELNFRELLSLHRRSQEKCETQRRTGSWPP